MAESGLREGKKIHGHIGKIDELWRRLGTISCVVVATENPPLLSPPPLCIRIAVASCFISFSVSGIRKFLRRSRNLYIPAAKSHAPSQIESCNKFHPLTTLSPHPLASIFDCAHAHLEHVFSFYLYLVVFFLHFFLHLPRHRESFLLLHFIDLSYNCRLFFSLFSKMQSKFISERIFFLLSGYFSITCFLKGIRRVTRRYVYVREERSLCSPQN